MTKEEQRYIDVQADVTRFLNHAANDHSPVGIVGFGDVWAAAELFTKNEQVHRRKLAAEEVNNGNKNTVT